jgi:hypothetical protein
MRLSPVLACAALLAAGAAQAQPVAPAWTVDTPKDAEARLALEGGPDLRCVRKAGQVIAEIPVPKRLADRREGDVWLDRAGLAAPWPASVTFVSGEASATLRGQARPDEVAGGSLLHTEISTAAPVIEAWRKTGLLEFRALGESLVPPPAPKGMIRKFLGACR